MTRIIVKMPNGDIAVDLTTEQRDIIAKLTRAQGKTPCGACGGEVHPSCAIAVIYHPECLSGLQVDHVMAISGVGISKIVALNSCPKCGLAICMTVGCKVCRCLTCDIAGPHNPT